jgi:hypothetical protein
MLCGLIGDSNRNTEAQTSIERILHDEKRMLPIGPSPEEMTKRLQDLRRELEDAKVDY